MYGQPGALEGRDPVELEVRTESESSGRHAVYFNRGPAAAQRYATKFDNRNPHDVGEEAWAWLSRGLREGMLEFLGQARGPRFGLRAAVYEFTYPPVLQAFRDAKESGVDVRIVCDEIPNADRDPLVRNEKAIADAGIGDLVKGRTRGVRISHNKFVVLLEDGKPKAVWTGSTNITEGASSVTSTSATPSATRTSQPATSRTGRSSTTTRPGRR